MKPALEVFLEEVTARKRLVWLLLGALKRIESNEDLQPIFGYSGNIMAGAVTTVLAFVAFLGIVAWAWSSGRRKFSWKLRDSVATAPIRSTWRSSRRPRQWPGCSAASCSIRSACR